MKVIKVGKWNVPWSVEAVCQTCEATVLVEERDVHPTYNCGDRFFWICLVCGKTNDLPSNEICQRLREAVVNKREYDSLEE